MHDVDITPLLAAGFELWPEGHEWVEAVGRQQLSETGPHTTIAVLRRTDVVVTIEQNVSREDVGGLSALLTYPPVATVEGPSGKACCDPTDVNLVLAVAAAVG